MRLGFRYSNSPLAALIFAWKDDYIIYNHHLLYIMGLVFSRYLTDFAFTSILILYFTNYGGDLAKSAIFSSIQSSLASFTVIILGHAAASSVGKFRTILFSTTSYICGLMFFWMFNPYDELWLVGAALVLLALGRGGNDILAVTLVDLLDDIDKTEDKLNSTRSEKRAEIWLVIATLSAAISAVLWAMPDAVLWTHQTWRSSPLICSIPMMITLVIFCIGRNVYAKDQFTKRATGIFFRVFLVHMKRPLKCCNTWSLKNTSVQDKPPQNRELDRRSNSYKDNVVVVKSLLRMFPIWGTFLVVSIISETGSTFFFEQYNNLNTDSKVFVQLYSFVQGLSRYFITYLYRLVCGRRWNNLHEKDRVRIGVGLVFGFLSCVLAWQVEVQRLKKVKYLTYNDGKTSLSFLLLVPQFCMLGCMEGLTEVGFLRLYESQVIENPINQYGEEYIEVVRGIGRFLNVMLILMCRNQLGWFGQQINDSRVDKYYLLLMATSSVNIIIYCCIAKYVYNDGDEDHHLDN